MGESEKSIVCKNRYGKRGDKEKTGGGHKIEIEKKLGIMREREED